ncbi:S-adenosyl-L-methionine-dependent methyltransferase [Cryomyces antarcticus]
MQYYFRAAASSSLPYKRTRNVETAVHAWIQELPQDLLKNISVEKLVSGLSSSFNIYQPMLLLPAHVFRSSSWQELFRVLDLQRLRRLYHLIAETMGVTHIAVNAPIPPRSSVGNARQNGAEAKAQENTLRSPTELTALYGDFGPIHAGSEPTRDDLNAAFWVSTRQNGITQIWPPRYTMFSRGNIKEKARLIQLPSVMRAVDEGTKEGMGCCAVDLYAGIGYFAFSYAKAGVERILCWELNGWSVEGLRRGAKANRWKTKINPRGPEDPGNAHQEGDEATILVYHESNEHAYQRIERMRNQFPPIRHVNCGLLPTSRGTWEMAIRILDPIKGGWIHIHENLALTEVDMKAKEITETLQKAADGAARTTTQRGGVEDGWVKGRKVLLEHVERVKSYAPGVVHCVLDICVSPSMPGQASQAL